MPKHTANKRKNQLTKRKNILELRALSSKHMSQKGGVGEAVTSALARCCNVTVHQLAVTEVPRSGKPNESLEKYGINASCIKKAVKNILK